MTGSTGTAWCQDLTRTYVSASAQVRALERITTRFPAASFTTVSGPSGSGKSTLLRLLAGLDRPTSGSLEVDGLAVHRASGRALARLRKRRVGILFQRPSDNLLPYLTVAEHLRLAQRSAGTAAVDPRALIDRLEIGHRLQHLPSELSGGEQHRVALASILASGRRIVLADEPTAALDTASARALTAVLRRAATSGVTLVVASHDPILREAAEQVVELSHGRLAPARSGSASLAAPRARPRSARTPPGGEQADSLTATGPTILEVRGARKSYRSGPVVVGAVRDATLSVRSGEVVGLLGRSGSGKTTLLNLIAGWEEPDGGTIARPGGDSRAPSWAEVALVPQKLGLLDELTIRANIEYPARLAGTLDGLRDDIDLLIDLLALTDVQHRHPRETSVGEQQRCAIARALVLSPALLLADEPAGHQDGRRAEAVFGAIVRVARQGTAALVATHGEETARFLDRVLAIVDGRVPAAS